jgi:hypothetical protein
VGNSDAHAGIPLSACRRVACFRRSVITSTGISGWAVGNHDCAGIISYGLDGLSSIPTGQDLSRLNSLQTNCGAHRDPYPIGTWALSRGERGSARDVSRQLSSTCHSGHEK